MGTHCEIRVKGEERTVVLFKHFDGYPEYVVPFLREFARFAAGAVGDQLHWLLYPEDVAALLICFDYERMKKAGYGHSRPDVRPLPKGLAVEARYAYELELLSSEAGSEVVWHVKCYDDGELVEAHSFTALFRFEERGGIRVSLREYSSEREERETLKKHAGPEKALL